MDPSLMCWTTGPWLWGAVVDGVGLFRGHTNIILEIILIHLFVLYFIILCIHTPPSALLLLPRVPFDLLIVV